MIDYNAPLETDEADPQPVKMICPERDGARVEIGGRIYHYSPNGEPTYQPHECRIRNVRTLRTSDECLARMEALVHKMAALHHAGEAAHCHMDDYAVAASLATQLPALPTDPDMIAAREVVCEQHHDRHKGSPWHDGQAEQVRSGHQDNSLVVQAAYHGVKRGRGE